MTYQQMDFIAQYAISLIAVFVVGWIMGAGWQKWRNIRYQTEVQYYHDSLRDKLNDVDMRPEAALTPEQIKAIWTRIELESEAQGLLKANPHIPDEYKQILEDMKGERPLDFAWDKDRFKNTDDDHAWKGIPRVKPPIDTGRFRETRYRYEPKPKPPEPKPSQYPPSSTEL